ncbi:MmgE/PrpD family protein [Roseovarius sp. A21]|uniref:MmgE/PrpD family protein n=1 Tax=Roseovarius bejariae TaxID=2576383 RepID=A0A844CW12_9RHOB|nr:MmgE/PrpD family protein [Roseovarius bejariae]MRU13823.1 MmgE/PrpD family protein [Roseovarius bejariae]
MTLARDIATFVVSAKPSAAAREIMVQSLYDWMVCGMAGASEPVAGIMRAQALEDGGTSQAAMFGGGQVPARAAALVNGTISHALDYDDTHFAHIGHLSVGVLPAVMACAPNDGAALLEAACIGFEVATRVGLWLGRAHYQAGFHQTATAGAFGATAAVARLRGFDEGQVAHALGLAATKAAGLKSQFGTMGKPMNAGLSAESGVVCADLAARGFISNPEAIDGAQGFGQTHAGEAVSSAWKGLGEEWKMQEVSHKLHACCHGLHAMIEALSPLKVNPAEVRAVRITTHPRWLTVCNQPAPETGLGAKFSYAHVAGMVLHGWNTADIGNFSDACAQDPALVAFRDKVSVTADDALSETETHIVLEMADGTPLQGQHDLMADVDPGQKWQALRRKGRALVGDREAQIWQAVQTERAPAPDALSELMQV